MSSSGHGTVEIMIIYFTTETQLHQKGNMTKTFGTVLNYISTHVQSKLVYWAPGIVIEVFEVFEGIEVPQ